MGLVCSTESLTGDKGRQWQEVISTLYAPIDVDIGDRPGFNGAISKTAVGPLELTRSVVDCEFSRRTPRHIAKDMVDNCLIVQVRQGPLTVSQFGRECHLGQGAYTLLDLSAPYTLSHVDRTDTYFLKIAKRALGFRLRDIEGRCAVLHGGGTGMAAIGADLMRSLDEHSERMGSAAATALAEHVVDFFGIVFDAAGDDVMQDHSIACSAIRRRALQYIEHHLADSDLSPERIAVALRISVRYLHRVFEGSGLSVGGHVRQLRLTRCRDALLRSTGGSRRISEIAEQYGFTNSSHFSTAFKQAFGMAPSEVYKRTPADN